MTVTVTVPPASESIATVVPEASVLDDLELLRCGVDLLADPGAPIELPNPQAAPEVEIREPEGVPLARVRLSSADARGVSTVESVTTWLAPRPERPFEALHTAIDEVAHRPDAVLVAGDVAGSTLASALQTHRDERLLVLVPAAVERDGAAAPDEVAHIRRILADLGAGFGTTSSPNVDVAIIPVGRDHPHRASRLQVSAAAYARGSTVEILDAEPSAMSMAPSGAVLFFTGLSGSGKSTLARAVRNRLLERTDRAVTLLDGDVVRHHLSAGLGFSPSDRDTNIRRIGWVAAQIAEHGGLAIASPIAPFADTRAAVARMVAAAGGRFVLIHVATPLAECERRDRKGLYARARRGEIPDFTGISSPYEEPPQPDLRIDTTGRQIEPIVEEILASGADWGLWPALYTSPHERI